MKTKKRILYSLILSCIIYLCISFVKWDILWVTEIPSYEWSTRFVALLLYFCSHLPVQLAITTNEL